MSDLYANGGNQFDELVIPESFEEALSYAEQLIWLYLNKQAKLVEGDNITLTENADGTATISVDFTDAKLISNITSNVQSDKTVVVVHYTDGTADTFNVLAGPQGERGPQGLTGATGPMGPEGPAGADGQDGFSPEVTITSITGGHAVKITDEDHPEGQTFNVMDGVDGRDGTDGTDGTDGFSPEVTITPITGGHSVNITDEDHPAGQTFDVMDGTDGTDGVGVPAGGTKGNALMKSSATDYATEWIADSLVAIRRITPNNTFYNTIGLGTDVSAFSISKGPFKAYHAIFSSDYVSFTEQQIAKPEIDIDGSITFSSDFVGPLYRNIGTITNVKLKSTIQFIGKSSLLNDMPLNFTINTYVILSNSSTKKRIPISYAFAADTLSIFVDIPSGMTVPAGTYDIEVVEDNQIPEGGTAGQVLSKVDGTDFNTEWVTPQSGGGLPSGGDLGQTLIKNSSTDDDASWKYNYPAHLDIYIPPRDMSTADSSGNGVYVGLKNSSSSALSSAQEKQSAAIFDLNVDFNKSDSGILATPKLDINIKGRFQVYSSSGVTYSPNSAILELTQPYGQVPFHYNYVQPYEIYSALNITTLTDMLNLVVNNDHRVYRLILKDTTSKAALYEIPLVINTFTTSLVRVDNTCAIFINFKTYFLNNNYTVYDVANDTMVNTIPAGQYDFELTS